MWSKRLTHALPRFLSLSTVLASTLPFQPRFSLFFPAPSFNKCKRIHIFLSAGALMTVQQSYFLFFLEAFFPNLASLLASLEACLLSFLNKVSKRDRSESNINITVKLIRHNALQHHQSINNYTVRKPPNTIKD